METFEIYSEEDAITIISQRLMDIPDVFLFDMVTITYFIF